MHARLIVAMSLAIAAAFAIVALRFLSAFNVAHAPLADAPVVVAPAQPRLARHVVLVIADGLRVDASHVDSLDQLRAAGASGVATVPWPTLSLPNYVTILTGVEPRWSGVRDNEWSGPIAVDSLPARLAAAGMRVAYASDQHHRVELFEPWETALRAPRGEDLFVLAPSAIDNAGHHLGGASRVYRETARLALGELSQLMRDVDLQRDAIVIVADHGHTDGGGHGDGGRATIEVPLVLAGAGIRRGAVLDHARLVDVAPTIAALLGLPAPAHATGRTLVEALAVDGRAHAGGAADPSAQTLAVDVRAYARADAERSARLAPFLARIAEDDADALARARVVRSAIAIVACVLAFAALVVTAKRRAIALTPRVLVASIAFPVAYLVAIPLAPFGFLPPHISGDTLSLVLELSGYIAIAAGVQTIATIDAILRSAPEQRRAVAAGCAGLGALVTGTGAAAMWALFGEPYAQTLPDPAMFMLAPIAAAGAAVQAACGTAIAVVTEIVWWRR